MKIEGSVALVTGANRGIGEIFVRELLRRGAKKVYAGARDIASLGAVVTNDRRIVPLEVDVTNPDQVDGAVATAQDLTLLINNAGMAGWQGVLSAPDVKIARDEMEVNYFGVLLMSRAFAPILAANGGGAIVNILSMLSLVTLPAAGTYSASKAAALALTRSLRAELKHRGTAVIATLPVQVETAMGQPLPEPRLKPEEVVLDTLDGVERGTAEVFPGALTRNVAEAFEASPKAVQAQLSEMLPAMGGSVANSGFL
ncbi:SDR family oxidoreductase [Acidiphilium sp. JA12-A1]|uniref:SDR family oxidoreductase n=1 Tax=Acidiphilium sp. JA12-A1 TaxID=1464546 RepID=UPI000460E3F3|nr:SDR family oxidoreductase [Acidiphilium sp. JA12-A1]KDM66094.1 short-chain dehydrogenase [Acidiphilium sp. JA12-A1]